MTCTLKINQPREKMPIKTKYVRYYYGVIIKDQPFNFVLTEYLSRFGHDIFKGCFCPDEDR